MIFDEDIDFLEHFGVKGMRWGVRNDRPSGTSRRTDREARKDAKEFATAKMFYGEGAGTRRKLIKNTVEAKSKRDPSYKKAFDHHLNSQDMSKHTTKATKQRSRKDRKDTVKKSGGYVARRLTGEMGTKAAFTAIAIGGAAFLRSPRGKALVNQGVDRVRSAANSRQARQGADYLADYFSRNG